MSKYLLILATTLIISGCGQKGPLYLPAAKSSLSSPPARETTPAPAKATPGKPLLQQNVIISS